MTVLRHKRQTEFTITSNASAQDSRLSFRARGLLWYMTSLPEDYDFSAERMAADTKEGRQAVQKALTELRTYGYLLTEKIRLSTGKTITVNTVSDESVPEWEAIGGKQNVEKPTVENPSLVPPGETVKSAGQTKSGFSTAGNPPLKKELTKRNKRTTSATPPRRQEPEREDVNQLCDALADGVVRNGSKRPTIGATWKREARLLLDEDERDLVKALALIDWCQGSTFWRKNIMSMTKFRQKYDQLRLAAVEEWEKGRATPQGPKSSAPERLAEGQKCSEHRRALPCGLCRAIEIGGSNGN